MLSESTSRVPQCLRQQQCQAQPTDPYSPPACRCPPTAGGEPDALTYHSWKRLDRKFWMNFTELCQDGRRWDGSRMKEFSHIETYGSGGVEADTSLTSSLWSGSNFKEICEKCRKKHLPLLCRAQMTVGTGLHGMRALWQWVSMSLPHAGGNRMAETTCWEA